MKTQHVTLRLPVDLNKRIEQQAKKEDRTRSNFIIMALRKHMGMSK